MSGPVDPSRQGRTRRLVACRQGVGGVEGVVGGVVGGVDGDLPGVFVLPVGVGVGVAVSVAHCRTAGSTGTGKSVSINAMILSLLFRSRPDQVKLIMIDPKRLELGLYQDIPHLLVPVVTEPRVP